MINIKNFKPRVYQENILKTCINHNSLVVLPTGMGKSFIFLLLAVYRLNQFPESKVLLCSPTKPLSNQISELFKNYTDIDEKEVQLLTGAIRSKERAKLWKKAKVVVATPQTVKSDLSNNLISLEDFSLLTIDEAHRSRMRYANTFVAKRYMKKSENPRILALTASPGWTRTKINEITKNLFIEGVEIRGESDPDVKPYIQEKKIKPIYVELPEEFTKIKTLIKGLYKEKVKKLKNIGISKPPSLITKKYLIVLQIKLRKDLERGYMAAFHGISLVAQIIKLDYALELLETQGVDSLANYWIKLLSEKTKAAKNILSNKNILEAVRLTNELKEKDIKHPKIEKLISLIEEKIKNPDYKIIIFANFREMVNKIVETLSKIPGAKPVKLIGQKAGITQKKQIKTIKDFEKGTYNILVCTSIGEEGLDIAGANLAIFYEPVPSEIRLIQRAGRVGRISKGEIIFLITKKSRDEAYYWSAKRKETTMRKTLYTLKEKSDQLNRNEP